MATYGLKYQCTFDPPSGASFAFKPRYRLEILQKDYAGTPRNVKGGNVPVIHQWQTDQPKPAIKGSSLTVSLLNEGSLPLDSFFSVDDDEFKVRLYWIEHVILLQTVDNLLFEGFIVQDDCSEVMVDYNHEIQLTATDNLGLLKDIALDKAPASYEPFLSSTETYEITQSGTDYILLVSLAWGAEFQVGDKFDIDGGPQKTVSQVINTGSLYNIYFIESSPNVSSTTGVITIYRSSLLGKLKISNLLKRCLSATGLELNVNIYCNLFEQNHVDTTSLFHQTLIDPQTFNKGNNEFEDCYTVLEKIFRGDSESARFTIFQSEGAWNIIRWDELRYYSNLIPGYSYDSDLNYLGAITLPAHFDIDIFNPVTPPDCYPENGLTNKILRPLLLSKEQFDYKQPEQILRNYDLQNLGAELANYTNGLTGSAFRRTKEFAMPYWYNAGTILLGAPTTAQYFIRVVYDQYDNELERYAVVRNGDIKSYRIEVTKGDIFNLSFDFKTKDSYGGKVVPFFKIAITDGTTTKFYEGTPVTAGVPGGTIVLQGWQSNIDGFNYVIAAGDNTNEWHTVNIEGSPFPFDGHLYVYLQSIIFHFPDGYHSVETHYKDIRLGLTVFINESTKIIGQTHKSEQAATIKQKEEITIYADDSPRNFIAGTLFLDSITGITQDRTNKWNRKHIPLEKRNLGNITTFEQKFWRRLPRTVLEGSFVGLLHDNNHRHLSMLSVIKYGPKSTLNLVFGKLEIDYFNDRVNQSTLWEMYKDGETDADLTSEYEFKYLYETK